MTQDASQFKGLTSLLDRSVNCTLLIPLVDYDKTFYYHDEQNKQIVACRIEKVSIGNLNNWTRVFLLLNTPQGRKEVEYRNLRLFRTPQDCLDYANGKATEVRFETKSLLHLFPAEIVSFPVRERQFYPTYKRCYIFKDGKVCNEAATMRYLTFDKSGCAICILDEYWDTHDRKYKVYLSAEDCLRDNTRDIKIVGFEETETTSELMDTTNNHDAELVRKINLCYDIRRKDFCDIVRLLAKRDETDYPAEWNITVVCKEYCRNVADDKDLKTILSYCGW